MFWLIALCLSSGCGCGDDVPPDPDGAVTDGGSGVETCDDGVDDDGDGDTDCADLDCLVPPLDTTAPTRAWDAMRWVVEPQLAVAGCPPPQTGVDTSDLPYSRVAAVRGRVLDEAGAPLGATVRLLDHPEWGSTSTRADGSFHFLVDPREEPVLVFEAPDRLVAQRQPSVLDGAELVLDDVVLLPLADEATTLALGAAEAQLAQGPMVTDDDGSRQARVLFPAGTTASAEMPGGGSVPLDSLTFRATEYTVGELGPAAMPGALPSASAYTYAVELSADETMAMGAEGVAFDRPVAVYVDNFLDIPVGTPVPIGFYDRAEGRWEAEPDGIVLAIVDAEGGIDIDGDGTADDSATLEAFGIDDEERRALAGAYGAGTELWRFQVEHFSAWDCNWPFGFPPDAILPAALDALKDLATAACTVLGSIVDCENQTLGEWVSIEGTGHRLHYQSERTLGYEGLRRIDVPLLAQDPPESLKRIDVVLVLAGHRIEESFTPDRDARFTYTWDGVDDLGRVRQGAHPYRLAVSYVYDGVYGSSSTPSGLGFARPGEIRLEGNRTREEVAATRIYDGTVHVLDASQLGLGTFTLDVHHTYDPRGQTLHLGDGRRRSSRDVGWAADLAAGGGGDSGTGIPAEDAVLDVSGAAVGPDGSLYLSDGRRHRIVRVDDAGIVRLVAGTGVAGYAGDGGPATDAELNYPTALEFGPDGSLYFTSGRVGNANYVVRRVRPDGIIETVAGTGVEASRAYEGDGGLATEAPLALPTDVAVGPDGAVWIVSDSVIGIGRHFRVVDPSGRITTLPVEDGALGEVAFGGGSDQPYFTVGVGSGARLFHLRPDGLADRLAGGDDGAPLQVGVRAVDARYIGAPGLAVAGDGRVFIGARVDGQAAVLELGRSGTLRQVAGGGGSGLRCPSGAALSAELVNLTALAVSAEGELYVAGNQLAGPVCRMTWPFATVDGDGRIAVAASDGSEIYVFDDRGRHLETRHAMTGEVLWTFEYLGGDEGPLTQVTDGDGNVLRIEREPDGTPTAIVGPWGHRTRLEIEGRRLTAVVDPMERTTRFTYEAGDLLESRTDPRGGVHRFDYDARGRIVADTNATEGTQTFTETLMDGRPGVRHASPESRETLYERARGPEGGLLRIVTDPAGLESVGEALPGTSTLTRPDGSVMTTTLGSDPRFGMVAPTPREAIIALPSGLTSTTTAERRASLASDAPAGVIEQVDTVTHAGRTSTRTWDGRARTLTTVTAEGRQSVAVVDALGRVTSGQVAGQPATTFERDGSGRLVSVSREAAGERRVATFEYGSDGLLAATSNEAGDRSTFTRDESGWVTATTDGAGRASTYTRDPLGAVTVVERPGGSSHGLAHDADGRITRWTKPSGAVTSYTYDADGVMRSLEPPSGRTLSLEYDAARRLVRATAGGETETHAYDPATGLPSRSVSSTGEAVNRVFDGFLLTAVAREGVAATVSWTHDEDLRVTSESVTAGVSPSSTVTLGHDGDGLLVQAGTLTLDRNAADGRLEGTQVGAVATTLTRNAFGEVERAIASAGAARLYEASYARDLAARLTRETTELTGSTEGREYAYDGSGKLVRWTEVGAGGSYTYDARGLRTRTEDDRGTSTATYDGDDQLLGFGSLTFEHDADGYRSATVDGGARTDFDHDALGQLRTLTLPGGTRLGYRYDIHGRRVARTVDGAADRAWVYGRALGPIAELDGAGNLESRFVYGTAPHVPDLMIRAGVTYRLVHDLRGSVRQVVDTRDGSVVQELDYDPWGRVLRDTNPDFQPFAFAGGVLDPGTGLLRLGLRDYDPEVGRFLTPDPIGMVGGEDLYAYADDDPVNFIDPAGTHPLLIAVGFAVGCQLLDNGGDFSAIDWGQVAFSVAFDMFGGPVVGALVSTAGRAGKKGLSWLLGGGLGAGALGAGVLGMAARRGGKLARSSMMGARLERQLVAREIAGGHAFGKHVVGRGEFPGVRTRGEFAEVIEGVIENHSHRRSLQRGRTGYWKDGVVVIRDPSRIDGGTAFVPTRGIAYFWDLL